MLSPLFSFSIHLGGLLIIHVFCIEVWGGHFSPTSPMNSCGPLTRFVFIRFFADSTN